MNSFYPDEGATQLMQDVLDKSPVTTVVAIGEFSTDSWGIGGDPVTQCRQHWQ